MILKKHLLWISSIFMLYASPLIADEGMWQPFLLKGQIEANMKAIGSTLNAEEIYNEKDPSIKDGVVHFGGGCTGGIVSDKGLLFTNHHCGYFQIQSLSTLDNDLLTHGFWAKNNDEELPCTGLSATFIIRIEDVTSKVLNGVHENMRTVERDSLISLNSRLIENEAIKETHYSSYIKPVFSGNSFYLYVVEVFKDVRLVGAPPSSIGKFGHDSDNWLWPKHTGDFALFRVYAGADNKPAAYSKDNVPFIPRYVIPVSIKGVKENDFTMVYGFPGTTKQYLTSDGISLIANVSNPTRIKLREIRLNEWGNRMSANDTIRLAYASKQNTLANYYQKFQGEIRGLRKSDAINVKIKREEDFTTWANSDLGRIAKYGNILQAISDVYAKMPDLQRASDHYSEAILGNEILLFARGYSTLLEKSQAIGANQDSIKSELEKLKRSAASFYKNYRPEMDRKISYSLLQNYYQNILPNFQSPGAKNILQKAKGNVNAVTDQIFDNSYFRNEEACLKFLNTYKPSNHKKLSTDPAFKFIHELTAFHRKEVSAPLRMMNAHLDSLYRIYMQALFEKNTDKPFYADANSTLRISYGKIEGYKPFDGAIYEHYTTLDGLMAKADPNSFDYLVPQKLTELWLKKDYGKYAKNGQLSVNFISSNHTTGGNSGSPILNANGELIGLNFDRNWEGTSSEFMYDPSQVRNISVDIRYALFIVDKFAGATHLLDEMKIIE